MAAAVSPQVSKPELDQEMVMILAIDLLRRKLDQRRGDLLGALNFIQGRNARQNFPF